MTDPVAFVTYLQYHGFNYSGPLLAILGKAFPEPQLLTAMNVSAQQFYANFAYWLGPWRQQNPHAFDGLDYNFDPVALTADIESRIVKPTLSAGALFTQYPYLTRLYTTLSPEDMTRDPVFSYNPSLPDVPNLHIGTLNLECPSTSFGPSPGGWLKTDEGFTIYYPSGQPPDSIASLPASLRIEVLRETGSPDVVVDNTGAIDNALGINAGACSVRPGTGFSRGSLALIVLCAAAGLVIARPRRRVRREGRAG
jgi:hypothetical protein